MDDTVYLHLPQAGGRCSFAWVSREENGKMRHFGKPNKSMRRLHRKLNRDLSFIALNSERVSFESATGAFPERSAVINALRHRGNRYFFQTDIRNAYASVSTTKLAVALVALEPRLASSHEVVDFLNRYCIHPKQGGLITGAPASPMLFNVYCAVWMDAQMRRICRHGGMVYSRYIDDLTVSSTRPIGKRIRREILDCVRKAGLTPHRRKTEVLDLVRGPVTITGLRLWNGGHIGVTEKLFINAEETLSVPTPLLVDNDFKILRGFSSYLSQLTGLPATRDVAPLQARINNKITELVLRESDKKRRHRATRPAFVVGGRIFSQWLIDELRYRIPIEKVVAGKVKLKARKGGKEFVGLCPFHNEKTPSFTVRSSAGRSFFHCFGCGEHGDAFGFVMKTEGLSFPEAVRTLARRFDIPLDE